jgi:MoaA/NifB/PqqE/SkfB family radical SAM enzyme
MMRDPIRGDLRVAVEISRRCNSRCRHCVAGAGPQHKHVAPYATLQGIIDEIAKDRGFAPHITLTGGEPLLFPEMVRKIISYASTKGIKVYIVTNGSWGIDMKKAVRLLELIGPVSYIEISLDSFHQEFIPFESVINAARACIQRGINLGIRGLHFGFGAREKNSTTSALRKVLKGHLDRKVNLFSEPLYIGGRATKIYKDLPLKLCNRLPDLNTCSILETIFISSYGEVYPCCSAGLSLGRESGFTIGNLSERPLRSIVEGARNAFIPGILRQYGVRGFLKVIESIKGKNYCARYYKEVQKDDNCQICFRIFRDPSVTSIFGGMPGK